MIEKEIAAESKFSSYQVGVIVLLALTQFTVVLDFMVMSPLGDMLIKSMELTPSQFGLAVSVYAFSAGISGLLTAGFADKFDRKKTTPILLCWIYCRHFVLRAGNKLCNADRRTNHHRVIWRSDRFYFNGYRC